MLSKPSRATTPTNSAATAIDVAAYVRMSTNHQQYSTQNQMAAIEQYAAVRNMSIVRTYSDDGVSGLRIENRLGLKKLIVDILAGDRSFSRVLVYDISRWGRFQDTDQSAFYEYLCRMNGAEVIYCAEPFENDHSPLSTVVKAVKRAMAAEYSRELSVRTFRGHCNLASYGYVQGGPSPYGLKHVVVGPDGGRSRDTLTDDRKIHRGLRVILAPSLKHEIEVVRLIFQSYVERGETPAQIAVELNQGEQHTRSGAAWDGSYIRRILANEQYLGTAVYNKTTGKLKSRRRRNDSGDWIRKSRAFEAIIEQETFDRAQERMRGEPRRASNEELVHKLRRFLAKHGTLSEAVIDRCGELPSSGIYRYRFGSMFAVYRVIGYKAASRHAPWDKRFELRDVRTQILEEMRNQLRELGFAVRVSAAAVQFWISDDLSCSFQISTRFERHAGPRWLIRRRDIRKAPLHLIARLSADGATVLDFYLVPDGSLPTMPRTMQLQNGPQVDRYRLPGLAAVVDHLNRQPDQSIER